MLLVVVMVLVPSRGTRDQAGRTGRKAAACLIPSRSRSTANVTAVARGPETSAVRLGGTIELRRDVSPGTVLHCTVLEYTRI